MKKSLSLLLCSYTLLLFSSSCSSESTSTKDETATEAKQESKAEDNNTAKEAIDKDLAKIKLPAGFKIDYYAKDVKNARSMALSPSGILYVGTRSNDKVFAIVDKDKDGRAEEVIEVASGLNSPNGVAIRNGDLYVAEISRVLKYPNIDQNYRSKPKYEVVNDKLPTDGHHGWKYIAFGPDNKLYVPVGAPCNICEKTETPIYSSIARMNPDGTGLEVYASGVRNTVGFDWHPQTKNLYFTDNGRDMLGDNIPPDELNRATKKGQHFGYPYCHGGDISDPEFGKKRSCDEFVKPVQKLGAHVAGLGMKFYTGNMFPSEYKDHIFIAEHGSWNRSKKSGYKISQVKLDGSGNAIAYEPFAEGWLQGEKDWGRPVDVLIMPDGAMLVSDDKNDAIYRISYSR